MSSGVREIPGYYYDTEKGKYFKVQANAPSNSAYSSHDVKRRKIENEDQQARSFVLQRQVGRIKRARILEAPLTGGFLSRELGQTRPETIVSSVYSQNLSKTGEINVECSAVFAITPTNLNASLVEVHLTCNADLASFPVSCAVDSRDATPTAISIANPEPDHHTSIRGGIIGGISIFGQGQSTSLSVNDAHQRIATTWLSSNNAAMAISPIRASNEEPEIGLGAEEVVLGTGRSEVSVYSSTSAPAESPYLFAFGSSDGILLVDKNVNCGWLSPSENNNQQTGLRDVFALDFLPNNHSVLLSGRRNGLLDIIDLRLAQFGSQADTITHRSSITHIKPLDDRRILVAGLNSSLCQYDLRFRKNPSHATSTKSHSHQPQVINLRAPTTPCLTYPDYKNQAQIAIGFDVDLELGIIAAAQDYDARIKLFSLHDGHVLNSHPIQGKNHNSRYLDTSRFEGVQCLKFVQDTPNFAKSLWLSDSKHMVRWAWDLDSDGGDDESKGYWNRRYQFSQVSRTG